MSLTLQEVKAGLLDAIKALGLADDVRLFPLNKIKDEKFLDFISDLRAKAVLLVQKNFSDRQGKRTVYFSAIICYTDPKGEGDAELDPAVEKFFRELIGADILRDSVWVMPEAECANVGSDPQRAIAEIVFQVAYELDKAVTA